MNERTDRRNEAEGAACIIIILALNTLMTVYFPYLVLFLIWLFEYFVSVHRLRTSLFYRVCRDGKGGTHQIDRTDQ